MEVSQENPLENILRLAANEPAHRPEFFKVLLNSTVYLLGRTGAGEGRIDLEAGSKIDIQHWEKQDGTPTIPFFSSLEILQKSIDSEQSYLALPAKSLFEMTLGTNLFLNPKSPYRKEFFPNEIKSLLSFGVEREAKQRTTEKDSTVLLGQPAIYPSKMANSLTQLLAKHSNVKRAFLALMHDTLIDEKPHLIVAIDTDGEEETIMREVGNVAADTAPDHQAVDLISVSDRKHSLSEYFLNQVTPFYERKWSTKLRSFFGTKNV